MKGKTQDGGLKAGTATPAESAQPPTRAKKAPKQARGRSPSSIPKTRGARPQSRPESYCRVLPSESNRVGKKRQESSLATGASGLPDAPSYAPERISATRQPDYINDPELLATVDLELMRAELRAYFLNTFPVLDAVTIHIQAGCTGADKTKLARIWQSAGRIIGLPIVGITVYPAFQFQQNGQPYPLIREVNEAFTEDCTEWQRASWLVSPNEWLDGETPVSAIQRNDPKVVDAAAIACEVPVG